MSWPTVPAAELMLKRGGSVNPANYPDETFELLSIPAFDKGEPEIVEGEEIGSSKSCVQPNDVLLSKIVPHIKRCWVVPAPQGTYRQIGSGEWIIFRSDKIHPPFLRHFLTSEIFHKQFMNTTAGVGGSLVRARPAEVGNIEIPLPPLPEQKRIAAILDKADAIRRKRQQAIQLADDFLRAVFLDMFGDPVTNPKGWEVDALEQLSTRVTKGESPKWQGFEYGSEGVRFITSENVLWGSLDERMKFIPLEFHQKLKRSQVKEGDLLINLVGASVGRACLAELNGVPANINQAVSVTTLDHSRLLPEIALYQLLVPSMQRVLLGNVVDAARANISLADIRNLQMLVPPIDVQLAFLKVLGKVKKYMAVNSSFSGLNLFESLSHNAFSGQL